MTAAAERLRVTQPSLSQQIGTLEKHLGVKLFTRTPTGVTVTVAGRAFLAEPEVATTASRRAVTAARAANGELAGEVITAVSGRPSTGTTSTPGRLPGTLAGALRPRVHAAEVLPLPAPRWCTRQRRHRRNRRVTETGRQSLWTMACSPLQAQGPREVSEMPPHSSLAR
ncbi:LysR family transcriptional regulator [Streptomyces tendae]|uniref:LysR family transcriptional regulator n=1 Tax=Streptomyces tendae TaxID=1932 RepID=UPI0038237943